MPLSCDCEYYPEPGDTFWLMPDDYSMLNTKRRKRCSSCKGLIDVGNIVAAFDRYKVPDTDIEIRIHGEEGEIPRSPIYLCEECADLFFSLEALGFCVDPYEDQRALVNEYSEVYGPRKQMEGKA